MIVTILRNVDLVVVSERQLAVSAGAVAAVVAVVEDAVVIWCCCLYMIYMHGTNSSLQQSCL